MAWPAEGQHTLDFFTKIPGASGQGANSSLVSIGTFSWESIRNLRKNPKSSSVVMTATVVVVVATHNLALGVLVGVLLSALFFAAKISKVLHVGSSLADEGLIRQYTVVGQVFFTSADRFIASFDLKEAVEKVVIDVSRAHFWDITAVGALDKVIIRFRREGTEVEIIGLNKASETMVDRFAVHDKPEAVAALMGH